jgi:hypothetical protein
MVASEGALGTRVRNADFSQHAPDCGGGHGAHGRLGKQVTIDGPGID